jgi:putative tricarboxylic transport membrane protein
MARQKAASGARPGRHAGHGDRELGAGLLAIGGAYLAAAFLISEPEAGYAAVGPRVFPIVIGIALVTVALWTAFRAHGSPGAPSAGTAPARTAPAPASDAAAPAADWRAAAPSALAFLAYIALLEPLGYLLATITFIAIEARLLGSRRWGRDLLAAILVAVTVYTLFSLLLGLRLPAGLLGGA